MVQVFGVPIFFICLRECLETSIIVSVLLSFLKQALPSQGDAAIHKRLVRQIWWGVVLGLVVIVCIGGGMIGAFYGLGKDLFSKTEDLWEGIFSLLAAVIITLMGAALLRVNKMQAKWRNKIAKLLEAQDQTVRRSMGKRFSAWAEKNAMFVLPFITVLREGLEAVIFIGGVGLGSPASSFPLAVLCGLLLGCFVGWLIYKGGNRASLQIFLIISTCFLYLVAAGLFSKAVWSFENRAWSLVIGRDAADVGSGPGSYNIHKSVWHVNCCNGKINGGGGWGIFNAIFGWQNSATYGSVIAYNLYWIAVMLGFLTMRYSETHGHLPFLKPKKAAAQPVPKATPGSGSSSLDDVTTVATVGKTEEPPSQPALAVRNPQA